MDPVQLGLVAPYQALAIASFSIGLPKGLFAKLESIQSNGVTLSADATGRRRV